jgi:hypothetical protein
MMTTGRRIATGTPAGQVDYLLQDRGIGAGGRAEGPDVRRGNAALVPAAQVPVIVQPEILLPWASGLVNAASMLWKAMFALR